MCVWVWLYVFPTQAVGKFKYLLIGSGFQVGANDYSPLLDYSPDARLIAAAPKRANDYSPLQLIGVIGHDNDYL